jgi:formylglycine-generating enzyme required for sulfatase activity
MTAITYQNFDLLIENTQDDTHPYRARVVDSPVGEANVDFKLPFSESELRSFFWLSGRVFRNLRLAAVALQPAPLTPQQFGTRLYQAVFAGQVGTCLLRSLDAVGEGAGLRIRLRLDRRVPRLADLPWEYLYAPDLNRFIVLSSQTVIAHYIELPQPQRPLRVTPPLRILALVSDPSDAPTLDVVQEWGHLQAALADLQAQGLIVLERLATATLPALQDRLRRPPNVHILHYIGHGYYDENTDTGGLMLEYEDRRGYLVDAERLATLLHDHTSLRLVFLNACEGARGGRDDFFAGTAQRLVSHKTPAVIAMQFKISDKAALILAQEFYEAIADGYSVDAALAEARKAVYFGGDDLEWGTPVLFSRSPDNQILELVPDETQADFEPLPFEPETITIPAGLFLMGSPPGPGVPEHETPQHEIDLPAYRIGKFPVTNDQYAEFIRRVKTQDEPEGWFLRKPPKGKNDHPVVGVNWYDAQDYCRWLSGRTGRTYRLPSEAEWEKAARGPNGQRYPWGESWFDGRCNAGGDDTTPVKDPVDGEGPYYPEGSSPYGCYEMLGNVEEWSSTLWGGDPHRSEFRYPYNPDDGREEGEAPAHVFRVHRGGSFQDRQIDLSCSARSYDNPESRLPWHGFRVVQAS